ncbi:MAG: type II secretion system protein [Epsilonproteobacteria bacterium]|nr:type II secretion system protein [Campylobacterota bacterium]
MRRGFTLIELAIAVAIIGLLVAGSFQAMKSMRQSSKLTESKEILGVNRDALLGYVKEWPNLPDNAEFDANITQLGSLQTPLLYAVDTNLSTINNDICFFSTTNLSVVDHRVNPARTIPNVAFVLAHPSANNNLQTALDTTTTPQEVHVYAPNTMVDDNTALVDRVELYDDTVTWATLAELKQSVDCSLSTLKILNDYVLPRGLSGQTYINMFYADGGATFADSDGDSKPDYEWCFEGNTSWKMKCNGTDFNVVANCSSAPYQLCTSPELNLSNPSAGTYQLGVHLKDRINAHVQKNMILIVDLDTSGGSGGTGGTGGTLLPGGAACTSNEQCASGNCLGNGTCHN